MQMFVAINTSLLNAGQVIITDPPTNVVVNPITPVTIYAEATGVFWVTWAPGTLGDFVLMAQSKLVSGGVSFNKTFTQVQASDASYGFFNFTSYFAAQWGAITTGRRVFARLTPVNSSGRSLPGVIVATTAVAGSALPIPVLAASVAGSSAVTWTGGTTANILVEESADGGVTWNVTATYPGSVTTQAVATAGAGNKFRVTLLEGSVFSRVSNVEAGS
jgi:hypothetical protein